LARASAESLVTQSVLDRLIAVEDWPTSRSSSVRFYREAIKRDLEWLLNTRQPPLLDLDAWPAAKASGLNYGLPDITSLGLLSASDHNTLRSAIATCLRNYEPRLTDIHVTLEAPDVADRRLRFHIDGNLRLDPSPEEIAFDTVLELASGEYKVK